MDLNELIGQLYTYGPYAVLALFVFWVAPKQTRVFLECNDLKDKLKRSLCGGVALACWIIVMLMVVFIYRNWSPTTVYEGGIIGRHNEKTKFVSQNDHLYFSPTAYAADTTGQKTVQWIFAVIDSKRDPEYRFTYIRNGEPYDYAIMSKDLLAGYNKISIDPIDSSKLNISNKVTGKTKALQIASNEPSPLQKGNWMTVFAQGNNYQYVVEGLISDDYDFLALARKELHSIPETALKEMLAQPDLPAKARQQIENELKQRPIRELR